MPNNWKTYNLEEISINVAYGYTASASIDNIGPKFLRITDIQDIFIDWESVPFCKIKDGDLKKNKLEVGDIVVARTGNSTGATACIKDEIDAVFASYLIRFRIDKEIANPYYIDFILRSQNWKNYVEAVKGGSAQPGANAKQFGAFELLLPPLPEQQSIASILSAIDDKIENNLAINKTLEEMAIALYKHWFVDFGPFQDGEFVESELGLIPEGWEVKRLDELADFINGYAFKSGDLKNDNDGNSYHIFKMGHIERGGGLKENATKSFINKSKCEKLEKYILKVGDLLMAMTDMKDNVAILGNTALINENDKYIVNQRVGLIRPKNDKGIDYSFLYLTTNENSFIERLRSQANSGVQVNLSTDSIKSAKMIIGSKEINLSFNDIVKPLYNDIFQNKIENQTLTQLRDTLLPKLISGEVRLKEFREN